jgi:hypothetical protein
MSEPHNNGDADVCHICGRLANAGIGIGKLPNDPRWICKECVPYIEYAKDIRRWSPYEQKAIADVDKATGEFAAVHGTDIAAMDTETRQALWRLVCRSWGDGIRRALKTAPF